MECDPTDFFTSYKLSTGRRIHAMTELAQRALEYGIERAVKQARLCLDHDARLLVMEQQRRGNKRANYGPHARKYDSLLGHSVVGFHAYLEMQVRVFTMDSERGQAAAHVKDELFPTGPQPIVSRSYVEQHTEVDSLLQRAQEPELAAALAKLPDAPAMLERIRDLNDKHGRSIDEYKRVPTGAEVRAEHARGHELMLETVVFVFAHFIAHAPEDREGRAYVLEPLMRQNELVRQARTRRRRPRDIDVEPTPAAPTTPPSGSDSPGAHADSNPSGEFPVA